MALPKGAIGWRPSPKSRVKDAHYHALEATKRWSEFVAALGEAVTNSAAERERQDAERRRETTYARGEPGGS